MPEIILKPIGYICNSVHEKKDTAWGADISAIRLESEYDGGLLGLEDFSHAIIVFHLDKAEFNAEKHLQRHPQNREDMPVRGIFAQRGKDRPNRLGITAVEIVSVSENELVVRGLDAVDGTPVLDIKPYFPQYDKREGVVPEWVDRLMEYYFKG